MKEEIKLNKIEINKIEFSQKIIDVFNKYKEIANMFFNVDDYIFSLSLSHKKSCSYIKEKTSLNKIGFLPLNNVKNLNDYQINNIISSNYSNSNISSPLNNKLDEYKSCLFHIIFVGESLLIKSHLDNYPFKQVFPGQLILSDNLESLYNHKYGCPVLNEYLISNNNEYLLEDFFINDILYDIRNIEEEQCEKYPLFKLGEPNRETFNIKRFCFFRETLETDILSFYGIELVSKLRAIDLINNLPQKDIVLYNCKKKI
jgi:hypothetical protein